MAQPEMSPMPHGSRAELGGQRISGDDIDLPRLPSSALEAESEPVHRSRDVASAKRAEPKGLWQLVMAGGLIAALAVGGWWWYGNGAAETANPNWSYVAAAKNASAAQGAAILTHKVATGTTQLSRAVELSLADSNPNLTLTVQALIAQNDLAGANAAIQAAPGISAIAVSQTNTQQAKPQLQPGSRLVTAIRDGNKQFFQVRLFDCCAEDGDVVDLAIDGEHYARVPLTHAGTVLSIPMTPGTTILSLKGVHDGGGGITVSFETSHGEYFSQPIAEGEEFQVGVIIK